MACAVFGVRDIDEIFTGGAAYSSGRDDLVSCSEKAAVWAFKLGVCRWAGRWLECEISSSLAAKFPNAATLFLRH